MRLVGPSDIESLSAILLIPNGEAIFYGHFCLHTLVCLVGPSGLEPPTSCLSGTRSNLLSYEPLWLVSDFLHLVGGDDGIRTHDPLLAGQVLSQLSYTPIFKWL